MSRSAAACHGIRPRQRGLTLTATKLVIFIYSRCKMVLNDVISNDYESILSDGHKNRLLKNNLQNLQNPSSCFFTITIRHLLPFLPNCP